MKTKYKNIIAFTKKTSSGEEDELKNDDEHLDLFSDFRQNGAVFLSIVVILFLVHFQLAGQPSKNNVSLSIGLGFANQTWKPYQSDFLKTTGETVRKPYFSFNYDNQLRKELILRSGFGLKVYGTKNLNPDYSHSSQLSASYDLGYVSLSSTLMYIPFNSSKVSVFVNLGLGLDLLFSKKPSIQDQFPYNVVVYFDENDYRRWHFTAINGFGFVFNKIVFLEIQYLPSLNYTLNERQLQIRESFWGVVITLKNSSNGEK